LVAHYPYPTIDVSQRFRFLVALQEERCGGVLDFQLPSTDSLTRFIAGYFEGFYPRLPFTHLPTFQVEQCSLELLLSMCALGAAYRHEFQTGQKLFYVAKEVIFGRWQHRSREASRNLTCPETNSGHQVDEIRCLLCLLAFSTWQSIHELKTESPLLYSFLAQSVRLSGLEESVHNDQNLDWYTWSRDESERRTKLLAFCFLNLQNISLNLPPALLAHEMELRLPCSCPEWNATDAESWKMLHENTSYDHVYFHEALEESFQSVSAENTPVRSTSPVANYILVHGLVQHINWVQGMPLIQPQPSWTKYRSFFEYAAPW
jgi:hypothetical protein